MPKKRIMIVDDDTAITKLLKTIIERSPLYEVHCENSGAQALSKIKAIQPDLVVLDVNMPDMSGGEISAIIRENPLFRNLPVIFLTGSISEEEVNEGLTISGYPALAKPIDISRLMASIEKCLNAS